MSRMIACLALIPGLALAGPDRHELPQDLAQADCTALVPKKGLSRVYLPDGPKDNVSLVLVDGRIAAVGVELEVTGDTAAWNGRSCAVVDTSGRTVTAGLVEVSTQMGLVEVGLEGGTRNADDHGGPYGAALRVVDAYDPRSTLIPVTRMEGVTSALVLPQGGRLAGTAAFADLAGATQAEALDQGSPAVAVVASLGGPSRAGALADLRAALDDARAFARKKVPFSKDGAEGYLTDPRNLAALQPVIERKIPLILGADRAADIEALLRFAKEERVHIVISGGAEAWMLADDLANSLDRPVPVIVDPMVYGAGGFDQVYGRADNAALLEAAGVPVLISTFSTHNARLLRQSAGNAVRGGLDHDAAIHAITVRPGQVFGLPRRGGIAAGQVANVVVYDGDPLELTTSVTNVFIEGRAVPLDSRQWRLFLQYQDLPGTPTQALPLPQE